MSVAREQRRLAAIVAADVVGYSRLMGRDESGTLARLRAHRIERLEPTLARHGGRLVKLTGDGALAEFPSAVDALSAAIAFQQAMSEANRDVPEDTRIVFRIGLHLGDLIVEGDDLYGDGVNVAARLEGEAPAGGIVVSGTVHESVTGRLKATFHDLGDLALKNIERPVRAFRVAWNAADWPTAGPVAPSPAATVLAPDEPLALPDKPSIAVLAFTNMSGDPEQEYFTDGISEDIVTELSRFHSLFVIARNSSFSYKGKSPDIRQVGRELGVRYVLEGSIRRAANRIRVTAQLIDTLSGNHIWAERYDRVVDDVFAVQEEVTGAIVAAVSPQIDATERSRATRRRPGNLGAYEIAVRAWHRALEGTDKADVALLDLATRDARAALAIDPNSTLALHAIAYAQGSRLYLRLAIDPGNASEEIAEAAARALAIDDGDPRGYALRALAVVRGGRYERYADALGDARRAHELNPNDTFVLHTLGMLECGIGDTDWALDCARRILRLSPREPRIHAVWNLMAVAHCRAGRYEEGIQWETRVVNDMPRMAAAHNILVVCLVGAGRIEEAKAAFATAWAVAPEYFLWRLDGRSFFALAEPNRRVVTFLRIAAGLEDPGAADALR